MKSKLCPNGHIASHEKPLGWIGSSKRDFLEFPGIVIGDVGYELGRVQQGLMPACAKPLKGFGGAGVLEIVIDHDRDTYRAVYTVKMSDVVYVLHCFQKKSRKGIATPKEHIALVKARLKQAEEEHKQWLEEKTKKPA